MNDLSTVITKDQKLHVAEDFYQLRREGIGFIEQLGSRFWTDYNVHDPGITILEALCYSITDLAYRAGWEIKDLLTTVDSFPGIVPLQAFYTARKIMTVNPVTPEDFRRLLIDLVAIRNAWIVCKECSCDLHFYSWCENNELQYGYEKPSGIIPEPVRVTPKGLYEVLLELEKDPVLGDLNDLKIEKGFTAFDTEGKAHQGYVELRFPEWGLEKWNEWQLLLQSDNAFEELNGESVKISIINTPIPSHKDLNQLNEQDFKRNWRNSFSISFEIELQPSGATIQIFNASVRVFGDEVIKSNTTRTDIINRLQENFPDGFIHLYRQKLVRIESAIHDAYVTLQEHRNLDEDYCLIKAVSIEDVAVCADIEVEANADIEYIQAKIWLEIEKYFNPPIHFYTLDEMLNDGIQVEEIFNGPALDNGFLKSGNLAKADLKKVLRVSDIINELEEIEGIIAINNLMLTKYDAGGNVIKGSVDPTFVNNMPLFDPGRISARWLMYVREQHQPRLYRRASSFLFFKNGLPLVPRMAEAQDNYIELAGKEERPKQTGTRNDLEVPQGNYKNPGAYHPVQHNFPLVYGIGPYGLPKHVLEQRKAEAKQLKGYLTMFEQLLSNSMQQVAHVGDLFSLNAKIKQTYFSEPFTNEIISGFSDLEKIGYPVALGEITEKETEFLSRRNKFLNHQLARFGENVDEYALLLMRWQGDKIGPRELIRDKINFLASYPRISHDRYRSFNYAKNAVTPRNTSGLHDRLLVLLGNPLLNYIWDTSEILPGVFAIQQFSLLDSLDTHWLDFNKSFTSTSSSGVERKASQYILSLLVKAGQYTITQNGNQFIVDVLDENAIVFGNCPTPFDHIEEALSFINEIIAWAIHVRTIVVEHLLLRPKFPGDALYPGCIEGPCITCGEEDPFSFRLTLVMPGWAEPYNVNLDMRGFADRTIREQVASHLIPKICWVGNEVFIPNPCDPVINLLTEHILSGSVNANGDHPSEQEACECSTGLYNLFADVFSPWYADKALVYIDEIALRQELKLLFDAVDISVLQCQSNLGPIRQELQVILIEYYLDIIRQGSQFEKFEAAWYAWLEENESMNWPAEKVHDHVEAILANNLMTNADVDLCSCADNILAQYGTAFHQWMDSNFKAGHTFENFTAFVTPPLTLCNGLVFEGNTLTKIELYLENRYAAYAKVSYRLWIVTHLLTQLRNVYPGATLHDCDDGGDENPVRLGLTALGNYPIKKSNSIRMMGTRLADSTTGRFATFSSLAAISLTSVRKRKTATSSAAKKKAAKPKVKTTKTKKVKPASRKASASNKKKPNSTKRNKPE